MKPDSRIDPELRILLEEAAKHPKAKLFRGHIPSPKRLVMSSVEPIGTGATGLTSVEREILRVYRDEVAKALRDAAESALMRDPLGRALTSVYADQHVRNPASSVESLLERLVMQSAPLRSRWGDDDPALEQGQQALALLRTPSTTASQFAGLSLRISPQESGWIHIARELILAKEPAAAISGLSGVIRRSGVQDRNRRVAFSWLGHVYAQAGMHPTAVVAYSNAVTGDDPPPASLMGWLVLAVRAADEQTAWRAAERIDPYLRSGSPGVLEFLSKRGERMAIDGPGILDKPARRVAQRIVDRAGPTSRMVIDDLE